MYDFTVLGLRYVSVATSALLLPWVMRARISDSRSLRPSPRPGQSSPTALRARGGTSLMTVSGMHRFQCGYQLSRRQRLGDVAVRSLLLGVADKIRVKVPRVHHDSACARIGDQNGDFFLI